MWVDVCVLVVYECDSIVFRGLGCWFVCEWFIEYFGFVLWGLIWWEYLEF